MLSDSAKQTEKRKNYYLPPWISDSQKSMPATTLRAYQCTFCFLRWIGLCWMSLLQLLVGTVGTDMLKKCKGEKKMRQESPRWKQTRNVVFEHHNTGRSWKWQFTIRSTAGGHVHWRQLYYKRLEESCPTLPVGAPLFSPQRVKTPVFSFIMEHSVSIKALDMSVSALEMWTFCFCCFLLCFIKQQWYPTFILAQAPTPPPPTVHPEGQEQSPVMWWHVPPFWQGQRCSQWGPWLPEGQRSPQLSAHTETQETNGSDATVALTHSSLHQQRMLRRTTGNMNVGKHGAGTHKAPEYPGAQMHSPVSWLQVAPLRHWQGSWHALP